MGKPHDHKHPTAEQSGQEGTWSSKGVPERSSAKENDDLGDMTSNGCFISVLVYSVKHGFGVSDLPVSLGTFRATLGKQQIFADRFNLNFEDYIPSVYSCILIVHGLIPTCKGYHKILMFEVKLLMLDDSIPAFS